ncbi:MAG: cache domain-containing protein [Candidatus Kerfeldbacteria bacterium]
MFKNLKIRTKIILPIITSAVIVLSAASFYSYYFNVKNLEVSVGQNLETMVQSRADHVDTVLRMYEQRARLLTSKTWMRRYLKSYYETDDQEYIKKIEEILVDVQTENPKFKHIEITNPRGQIIISTLKHIVGNDISDKDYFLKGKKDYTISNLEKGETEDVLLHTSGPLILDGEFLGVVAVASDGATLTNAISSHTGLGETGEIYLLNNDYLMLTSSRLVDDVFLNQKVDTLNSRSCFATAGLDEHKREELNISHRIIDTFQDYRGVDVLGSHVYISQMDWCLLAEIDESEALDSTRQLLFFSIIRSLIVLFIFFIVTYLIARLVTNPILVLYHGTEAIEKGNLNYKVGTNSKDEIGQLSRSFDKMTASIKKSRSNINQKVEERTKDLEDLNKSMIGRELKMIELKKEIIELKNKSKK